MLLCDERDVSLVSSESARPPARLPGSGSVRLRKRDDSQSGMAEVVVSVNSLFEGQCVQGISKSLSQEKVELCRALPCLAASDCTAGSFVTPLPVSLHALSVKSSGDFVHGLVCVQLQCVDACAACMLRISCWTRIQRHRTIKNLGRPMRLARVFRRRYDDTVRPIECTRGTITIGRSVMDANDVASVLTWARFNAARQARCVAAQGLRTTVPMMTHFG
jgi:hypothetical protein